MNKILRKRCKQCVYEKEPSMCPDDCEIKHEIMKCRKVKKIEQIKQKIKEEMNFVTELWKEGRIDEKTMKEIKCGLGQIGYMLSELNLLGGRELNKIEKIKQEVLEELIKNNCDLPSEFAVELAVRKTAKEIFEEIDFYIEEEIKIIIDEIERGCYERKEEVAYDCLHYIREYVIKELKRKWLGGEE